MSTPENPISSFITYAYHHVLMICDNVDTAVSVSSTANVSQFLTTTDDEIVNANRTAKIDSSTNGKYIILSNGLSDARYSLDNLKWESITGQMGDNKGENFTAMSTEGGFTIIEPKGLFFLNDIQNSYRALNSDPTACVWMIKTIFVGQTANGPEYITDIRPLIFAIVDLTADFTVEGGTYNISFVNINNGAAKLPQLMKIAETIKINLDNDSTLQNAIERELSSKVNGNSKKYFNEVKDTVLGLGLEPKLVEYEFILDDAYKDGSYTVDDTQQQNKTSGKSEAGSHLDFSKAITIENALKSIMRHSTKVKTDAGGDANGEKFGFKIRSILNSDATTHKITYYINRYKVIFSDIFSDISSTDQDVKRAIEENTIEFDYMYTGKNTDIIDFSMQMELGLVFFQTIISSNNIGTQSETQGGLVTTSDQTTVNFPVNANQLGKSKAKKPILPIFFSTKMKNLENSNSKNPKNSTEFQTLLNRHAGIENLNAKLKIHGNTSLLNSVNKTPENFNKISKTSTSVDNDSETLPHWENVPALARINIFMPTRDSNDITGREQFWYDGLYYVFGVTNEFNGGLFTQELDMISIPNSTNKDGDSSFTKDKTTNKALKLNKVATPVNTGQFKDFDEIKALVDNIGPKFDVDTDLILGLIKQESSFNTNAGSSAGARGLMQVTAIAAKDIGANYDEMFIAEKNIEAGTEYLKKMLNRFDGDVTLALAAYNAGPTKTAAAGGVPNIAETKHYVVVVQNNANNFKNGTSTELVQQEIQLAANTVETNTTVIGELNTNSIANILNIHSTKTIT